MSDRDKANILVVDDKTNNLVAMEALLEENDRNIITATSGNEALGLMLEYDFALVILDIQMPDMDGIETAGLMRQINKTKQTPIIFVTAINKEQQHVFDGYNAGAVDYIFKPFEPLIVKAKVDVLLQLYRQKKTIEQTNSQLHKMVQELEAANRKILYRHKAQIEEERLKVILQLAGATTSEMNQPLMQLLNSIELLAKDECDPENQPFYINEIKKSGEQIYTIAKRIQSIQISEIDQVSSTGEVESDSTNLLSILSVSNKNEDINLLTQHLNDAHKMNFRHADSIKDALSILENEKINLILTDYKVSDGSGFDLIDRLKENDFNLPVVFITDSGDEIIAARAIKKGAYDYLTKAALTEEVLMKTLSNAMEKEKLQKEIAAAYQRLAVLSTRDSLTKLYNRRYFNEAIESEISKVKRYGSPMSVCMIDLDHFKDINDQHGHLAGDKVLSKTAGILSDMVRECDVVCRYGGEEFGLILPKTYPDDAFLLGERIRKSVAKHKYEHQKANIDVTVSIGIASYNKEKNHSHSVLIDEADKALYSAKNNGRNRVEIYGDK